MIYKNKNGGESPQRQHPVFKFHHSGTINIKCIVVQEARYVLIHTVFSHLWSTKPFNTTVASLEPMDNRHYT